MMPVNQSAARLLVLSLAVAVVTGCPGSPTQTEEVKPVKPATPATKKPSTAPTGTPPANGASPTPTPAGTGSPTATASPGGATPTPAGSTSPKPSGSPSGSPSASTSPSASGSPSASPSASTSPSASGSPSASPSASSSPAASSSPSASPSASSSPAASSSPSASPTASPTAAPTATPTAAPTATPAPVGSGGPSAENGGVVTTLAGNKDAGGLLDETGTAAQFSLPSAVAVDASGNVYVADTGNHAIRKITPAGVTTTLAGSPTSGGNDGSGANAQFNTPGGIAVDPSGNVYVADTGNGKIRKIAANGNTVSTLTSTAGGTAISSPYAVVADRSGNVYVADTGNQRILKYNGGTGTPTVLAGAAGSPGIDDGTGATARFLSPQSITVDFSGNLYVADGPLIRKVAQNGDVVSLNVTGASFSGLHLATDRGADGSILYVTDHAAYKVWAVKKESNGNYAATLLAGGTQAYLDGTGAAARFKGPYNPFVTSDGTIYVPDFNGNTIRKIQ